MYRSIATVQFSQEYPYRKYKYKVTVQLSITKLIVILPITGVGNVPLGLEDASRHAPGGYSQHFFYRNNCTEAHVILYCTVTFGTPCVFCVAYIDNFLRCYCYFEGLDE
uniref:Uncharacterized protein n=1 Tax=Timema monikensis TaxID=170555 RepID=A0A7R9HQL5_9NEOP|nr:unnamed protein product [Timema monikensis]